ncbi:Hypp5197 [Branchiostoma lanceolatum]|uniref:Hypp5197 protein n=1 Tax=Branchiostoma lanceolatum TaxID=7740 RepID=A0A8K0F1B5_BRALA|nr:Hypp5197 [Branchiostoma lanceolatum]
MAAVQRQTSQWGHLEEDSDRQEHYEKEWWKWKGQMRGDAANLRKGDAAASQASQGGPGTWPGFRQNIPTVEQLHSVAPPVATTFTGIPPGGERPPSPTPPWRQGKQLTSQRRAPTVITISREELRSTVHTKAQSKLPAPQRFPAPKFEYQQPVQRLPSAPKQVTPQPVKVQNTPKMEEAPTNTPKVSPANLPAPSQATESHDHLSAEARADYEAARVVGHSDLSGYANVVYDLHVDKGRLATTVQASAKRVRSRGASASGSAAATREGSPVKELEAAGAAETQQQSAGATEAAPTAAPAAAPAAAAAQGQASTQESSISVQQSTTVTVQEESVTASVLESSAQVTQDAAEGNQPSWTVRGSGQGGKSGGGNRKKVFCGRPSDFVPDHLRSAIRAMPGQRSRYIKTYSYVAKHQLME